MGKNNEVFSNEELAAKVTELTASLQASANAAKVTELTASLQASANAAKVWEEGHKELQAENTELKAINENLIKEVEALSATAGKAVPETKEEAPKLSAETFEVDGRKFGFAYPVTQYAGKRITNADVLASEELQKVFVEKGIGMVKPV